MSSHHFVREKQEPALLIMNLAGFNTDYLGQLLEWSPMVVVAAQAYHSAHALGIKIDAVLSPDPDFDVQENTLTIPAALNPLEDGLKYLCGQQHHAVNIISNEFVLKEFAPFAERINLVVYAGNKRIFAVHTGFSKWKAAAERVELMHDVQHLSTSGLNALGATVFETEKDGFYTLRFDQPFIFIAEML